MDQQQQLNELKARLATLKGEPAIEEQPAPVTLAEQEAADKAMIHRIFSEMLGWGEERKRQEDSTQQVCSSCYLLQPNTNAVCNLCGAERWLVPSVAKSDYEHAMFINMATSHTIEQLRTALNSGWAHTRERERVARLLLMSREAKQNPRPIVETVVVIEEPEAPAPEFDVRAIDFKAIQRKYDREMAALS